MGHRVKLASNGLEALQRTAEEHFDLVLMDLQMPLISRLEAAKAIRVRELGTATHLPIIAMTAHSLKGDKELCLAAGHGWIRLKTDSQE